MVADFRKSVAEPDAIKAEEVTHEALLSLYEGTGAVVSYIAKQHKKWDFEVNDNGLLVRVDAKFDSHYERTGRLPFEFKDEYTVGPPRPTWGVHPGLDFVAVVPWTFKKVVLVPLGSLSRYVSFKILTTTRSQLESVEGWKWWEYPNRGDTTTWTTHGVAVPEERFAEFLNQQGEKAILTLPTDTRHHRESKVGRILLGGKVQGGPQLRSVKGGMS